MAETRIMIVAGEASGDMHGARLVAAIKSQRPDLSVCGMGGKEMAAQGVELLCDASKLAVVGILEVISHLQDIRAAMHALEQRLKEHPPHLLILIDYPDFNLMLAKKAKRLGIPVFYYISPQVWAWRSGRVEKIGRLIDGMGVILPFERDFYRARGVEVDFVGHPLLDTVEIKSSKADFLKKHGIRDDTLKVGILPGSRKKEITIMLPIFMKAAKLLTNTIKKGITFLLPLASTVSIEDLNNNGLVDYDFDVKVISGERYDLMASCDAVMAVSGTVTLELAILNVPMIVSYRVSPATYFLGRRLIKVKYASLVNLVADKEIVPELLQRDALPEKICKTVENLLVNEESRKNMFTGLAEVRERLGRPGASDQAAKLALGLIH